MYIIIVYILVTEEINSMFKYMVIFAKLLAYFVDLPVTVSVIVLRRLGGLINSFSMLDSVARGKPLSSISSSSYGCVQGHD